MPKITTYGATGRVAIGYSYPTVAKYTKTATGYDNSDARRLARGVSANIVPDSSDNNGFYADNQLAETDAGTFTGGELTLTVDGLHPEAARYIQGLPVADTEGWIHEGDSAQAPDVSYGHVTKYRCDGKDFYTPEIVCKVKFNKIEIERETQEEEIDWQTQELTAKIMRSDNENHDWKLLGSDWDTEAEALAQLDAALGSMT